MKRLINEISPEEIRRWLVKNMGPISHNDCNTGEGWYMRTTRCGVAIVTITDERYTETFNTWLNSL